MQSRVQKDISTQNIIMKHIIPTTAPNDVFHPQNSPTQPHGDCNRSKWGLKYVRSQARLTPRLTAEEATLADNCILHTHTRQVGGPGIVGTWAEESPIPKTQ